MKRFFFFFAEDCLLAALYYTQIYSFASEKMVYGIFFSQSDVVTELRVQYSSLDRRTEDRLLDVFQMYLCEFASFVPSCSSG